MHVCTPQFTARTDSKRIVRVKVGSENKDYNDCVLGFAQRPSDFGVANLHRVKSHKSVFMDCYGGGTYVDGVNQNNKSFRPEVGSVIKIEADFSTGEVTWTVEETGKIINKAKYEGLSEGEWFFTLLSCYADDKYSIC